MAAAAMTGRFRSRVVGQRDPRARLSEALRNGRAAHAYLISGPEGVGKTALALEFAALLLCERNGAEPCGVCRQCVAALRLQHPDLHLVFPLPVKRSGSSDVDGGGSNGDEADEMTGWITQQLSAWANDPYAPLRTSKSRSKKEGDSASDKPKKTEPRRSRAPEIRVKAVRDLLHSAAMKPYQAARKVQVILHADAMNTQTQNSLLKILEEPSADAFFILTAESEGSLLQTIRSRCQRIRLAPLAADEIAEALVADGVEEVQAGLAAAMSGGSFTRARELARDDLQELQQRVLAYLRAAAVCDPLELPAAADALLEGGGEREQTALEFIGLFLRDVAMMRDGAHGTVAAATFRGFEDRIRAMLQSYPAADFDRAARAADTAADYLAKGYTRDYVMYTLAIALHEALGRRAVPKSKPTTGHHA